MLSGEVRNHLEKYWHLGVRFFEEADFAIAAFFAITLIEEVGKVIILGNHMLSEELDKKGFRDHRKKYSYAAFSTLSVNARVSRIYRDQERRFAKWFREGELFKMRNSALYVELASSGVITPEQAIQKRDAFLLICFGGEVLAEIQGSYTDTGPQEWQRLINEVDAFREANSVLLSNSSTNLWSSRCSS